MATGFDLDNRVVRLPEGLASIADLLRRFADPAHRVEGIGTQSDLHVRVGEPIRYRIDGDLVPLDCDRLSEDQVRALVYPMLTDVQVARLESGDASDLDAAFELAEPPLAFRLNVFRDRDGLACAVRVLDSAVPDIEAVGFPFESTWKEIVEARQGLVIVTGVTGSGKSTTVASLLQHINRHRATRIITLEDPIEYLLRSERSMISQREIGRHVGSFEEGLRSALREDPDVLFVGEMRDRETTALALTAAETGHLVLSTLHTRDARGAVTRITDLFPSERAREVSTLMSFSMRFILAQRLIPRAGGRGRRVAMEVLRNIPPIANLIRRGEIHQIYATIEANRRAGLITLERHLSDLARSGEIDADTARRYANDPDQIL
jgi:twitching motility protein PilT